MRPYGLHKVNGRICDCPDCGNGKGKIVPRAHMERDAIEEGLANKQIDDDLEEEDMWDIFMSYNEIYGEYDE